MKLWYRDPTENTSWYSAISYLLLRMFSSFSNKISTKFINCSDLDTISPLLLVDYANTSAVLVSSYQLMVAGAT